MTLVWLSSISNICGKNKMFQTTNRICSTYTQLQKAHWSAEVPFLRRPFLWPSSPASDFYVGWRIKKFLETRFKQNGSSHITYIEYTVEPTNKIQQDQQDPISIVLHVIIWWTNSPKSAWFASKAAWKPWRCWNLCPEPERNGGRLRRDMVPCWKGDKQCWKGDFMWFPHGFHGFHIPWYLAMTREHHEQRGQVCQLIISDLDLWEPDHEFPWPLEVMEEIHKVMDCVCLPCSPWWSSMNLMLYRMIRMILQELFATKGGGCLKIHKIGSSSSSSSKFRASMDDEPMSYL